jgi:hypothetical protein
MDINPLDCACFSIGANVVFIIFAFKLRGEETPFRVVCQIDLFGARTARPRWSSGFSLSAGKQAEA